MCVAVNASGAPLLAMTIVAGLAIDCCAKYKQVHDPIYAIWTPETLQSVCVSGSATKTFCVGSTSQHLIRVCVCNLVYPGKVR